MNGKISLTFDDGWISHYTQAFPILESFKFKGVFYIISKNDFDFETGDRMNWSMIQKIQSHGHEIGSHTQTHPNLLFSLPWKSYYEIINSKKDLESKKLNIKTFCYPYGFFAPWMFPWIKKAGYRAAVSVVTGLNTLDTQPFLLRREWIVWDTDIETVKQKIKKAFDKNKWIILMFHQIDFHYNKYGTTPEKLIEICTYIKNLNIEVVTIESQFTS